MKKIILLVVILTVFVGVCMGRAEVSKTRTTASAITENMLISLNDDNYMRFSENFDEKMKNSLSEPQFKYASAEIKRKIGTYISKEYIGTELKDGYTVVLFKGKFSHEKEDVLIKTVLQVGAGKPLVSGLWLDSSSLGNQGWSGGR